MLRAFRGFVTVAGQFGVAVLILFSPFRYVGRGSVNAEKKVSVPVVFRG